MRLATCRSVIGGGSGLAEDTVWYFDVDENAQNPDVGTEVAGSEEFVWHSYDTGVWIAGMNRPVTGEAPDNGVAPSGASMSLDHNGADYRCHLNYYPVPGVWADEIIRVHSLAKDDTVGDYDRYLASALVVGSFIGVKIGGKEVLFSNPSGLWLNVDKDNDPSTFAALQVTGATRASGDTGADLITALCTANPSVWGATPLEIRWTFNNV